MLLYLLQLTRRAPTPCTPLTRIMRSCSMCLPCCPTRPTISNRYVNKRAHSSSTLKSLCLWASFSFQFMKKTCHLGQTVRLKTCKYSFQFVCAKVIKKPAVQSLHNPAIISVILHMYNFLFLNVHSLVYIWTLVQVEFTWIVFYWYLIEYNSISNASSSCCLCAFPVTAEATHREWYRHNCVPGTRGTPFHPEKHSITLPACLCDCARS